MITTIYVGRQSGSKIYNLNSWSTYIFSVDYHGIESFYYKVLLKIWFVNLWSTYTFSIAVWHTIFTGEQWEVLLFFFKYFISIFFVDFLDGR